MKTTIPENRPTTFFVPALDVIAVMNAVSKDESRYYLRGVYLESGPEGVQLVATDGHVMLRKIAPVGAFVGALAAMQRDPHNAGFILSVDVMEKAFKAKVQGALWLYGDTETGVIEFLDVPSPADDLTVAHNRVGVCEFERIDGTFPDWRRVMPKEATDKTADFLQFDPTCMEKLFKANKVYKFLGKGGMRLSASGDCEPIRVEFANAPNLIGVIMPMRF